jgi:hypothetical protein
MYWPLKILFWIVVSMTGVFLLWLLTFTIGHAWHAAKFYELSRFTDKRIKREE